MAEARGATGLGVPGRRRAGHGKESETAPCTSRAFWKGLLRASRSARFWLLTNLLDTRWWLLLREKRLRRWAAFFLGKRTRLLRFRQMMQQLEAKGVRADSVKECYM